MLCQFIGQEDELTSTISENCFWIVSFSATFSQIALIQGTAVREQIISPLGKKRTKSRARCKLLKEDDLIVLCHQLLHTY